MIYKLIASIIISRLFKRPGEKKVRKENDKYLKKLVKSGRSELAGTFRHADEALDALSPEEIYIESFDGTKLYGRLFTASPASSITFVLLHGYKGSGGKNFILQFDTLKSLGANILVVDERAHGRSGGKYITFGVKERFDAEEWVKFLLSRNENAKVILYGISMGASTALAASTLPAVKSALCGIIADCGFTSPADEFCYLAVFRGKEAPKKFIEKASRVVEKKADFSTTAFTTLDSVSKLSVPALFVHGENDRFVPKEFTVRNYEACTSPYKRLLFVPNAAHAGSFYHAKEAYTEELKALFFEAAKQ